MTSIYIQTVAGNCFYHDIWIVLSVPVYYFNYSLDIGTYSVTIIIVTSKLVSILHFHYLLETFVYGICY